MQQSAQKKKRLVVIWMKWLTVALVSIAAISYLLGNLVKDGLHGTSDSIAESQRRRVFIDTVYACFKASSTNETLELVIGQCWIETGWSHDGLLDGTKPSRRYMQVCLVLDSDQLTEKHPEWSIGFTKGHATGKVFLFYNHSGKQPRSRYLYYSDEKFGERDTFEVVSNNHVGDTSYVLLGTLMLERSKFSYEQNRKD